MASTLGALGPDGPDLDEIARAAGMDPAEMRGHAQRLWKHMDDLAERSPEEYRAFLDKQARAAGVDPAAVRAGGVGAARSAPSPGTRAVFLMPRPQTGGDTDVGVIAVWRATTAVDDLAPDPVGDSGSLAPFRARARVRVERVALPILATGTMRPRRDPRRECFRGSGRDRVRPRRAPVRGIARVGGCLVSRAADGRGDDVRRAFERERSVQSRARAEVLHAQVRRDAANGGDGSGGGRAKGGRRRRDVQSTSRRDCVHGGPGREVKDAPAAAPMVVELEPGTGRGRGSNRGRGASDSNRGRGASDSSDSSDSSRRSSHETRVTRDANGAPVSVETTFALPTVRSVADVRVETTARYVHVAPGEDEAELVAALPVAVDPDTVTAKFHRKERKLVVRAEPAEAAAARGPV